MSQVLAPDISPQEETVGSSKTQLLDAEKKIEELSSLCATQDQEVHSRYLDCKLFLGTQYFISKLAFY